MTNSEGREVTTTPVGWANVGKIHVGQYTVNGSDAGGWRVLEQFGAYRITKPFKTQAKAIKHAETLEARRVGA